MSVKLQSLSASEIQDLRRAGGRWLKDLREEAGLSQRQLAAKVGSDYYTHISQLETGRGRIASERYSDWAVALGVDRAAFVQGLLRFYDPVTYSILFEN